MSFSWLKIIDSKMITPWDKQFSGSNERLLFEIEDIIEWIKEERILI